MIGDSEPVKVSEFGTGGNFLWGNIHAIDCLNLGLNEGVEAVSIDFKLCFAGVFVINLLAISVSNFVLSVG